MHVSGTRHTLGAAGARAMRGVGIVGGVNPVISTVTAGSVLRVNNSLLRAEVWRIVGA